MDNIQKGKTSNYIESRWWLDKKRLARCREAGEGVAFVKLIRRECMGVSGVPEDTRYDWNILDHQGTRLYSGEFEDLMVLAKLMGIKHTPLRPGVRI